MPKAKTKKTGVKRAVARGTSVKKAVSKTVRKPSTRKKTATRKRKPLAVPKRVIRQAATRPAKRPFSERFGVGLLSLLLLLAGSFTNAAVVTGTGYDMRRSEALASAAIHQQRQPKEYLFAQAVEHQLDFELLSRIVACESGWRMVRNTGSSAFGYFQIIDATERSTPQYKEGARKFDPYTNIDMAVYLFSRYGSKPWNESKHCWGRNV